MVVNFCGDQILVDFVRFLIHEDIYAWCYGIIFAMPGLQHDFSPCTFVIQPCYFAIA